jgi:uncharacterized protein
MSGFSPSLPLTLDPGSPGYYLNKNMLEVVKQNFKNLVLTAPGERMMIPQFGVGIRNYLFQPNDSSTYSQIRSKINSQVKKYMPFISISDVQFISPDEGNDLSNGVNITIIYEIVPLSLSDALKIDL